MVVILGPAKFDDYVLPLDEACFAQALPKGAQSACPRSADWPPTYPMTGGADFCARATSGQVVAAPISVMNSRRLIASPEAQDKASYRLTLALWKRPGEVRRKLMVGQPMSALGQKRLTRARAGREWQNRRDRRRLRRARAFNS